MALSDRRSRERAQRHELIVAAARDLAEAEGWEAVTTRRLAEIVEYSQPVLYSHFDGRDAIVRAVALQGFEALALSLREARLSAAQSEPALRKVFGAYLNFAAERPAVYQAMFVLPVDIKFASDDTPPALKAGFDELVSAVAPFGGSSELRAEVGWAALHGLAALRRGGRIPQEREQARLDLLVDQIVAAASASP
jgi:AcrR family transcriptional regulator